MKIREDLDWLSYVEIWQARACPAMSSLEYLSGCTADLDSMEFLRLFENFYTVRSCKEGQLLESRNFLSYK